MPVCLVSWRSFRSEGAAACHAGRWRGGRSGPTGHHQPVSEAGAVVVTEPVDRAPAIQLRLGASTNTDSAIELPRFVCNRRIQRVTCVGVTHMVTLWSAGPRARVAPFRGRVPSVNHCWSGWPRVLVQGSSRSRNLGSSWFPVAGMGSITLCGRGLARAGRAPWLVRRRPWQGGPLLARRCGSGHRGGRCPGWRRACRAPSQE